MSSIVLIGAGAILLLIGVGLGLWWGSHRRQQEAHKVTELEKELDDYRSQVTDHFRQTAEQFTAIGKEYRKLYEHMASGAAVLCDTGQLGGRLSFPSAETLPKEVTTTALEGDKGEAVPPADFVPQESGEEPESELPTLEAEPSDEELRHTEALEEILTEHELARDLEEPAKTFH
jgi:uncharacterized membrane-anchored protein YhcB (DUF1043 family)